MHYLKVIDMWRLEIVDDKVISQAVVARLPRYYRYLGELKDSGIERISSQDLSKLMKVTASQIRQDFNNFGGFGQQGYATMWNICTMRSLRYLVWINPIT